MNPPAGHSVRGVVSSLVASAMFGAMFLVSGLLDASAESMFGWRMLVTGACFLLALFWASGRSSLADLIVLLRQRWWMPLVLVCTAMLVGVQMWLFAWSPMHGHGLDASLGYLLLPIVLVLSGRFLFHERVTRMQWWAVAVAAVAVTIKVVFSATFSWVTILVCLGYAAYFALRKRHHLDTQAAFGAEVAILCLAAVPLIALNPGARTVGEQSVVLLVGLGGAVAMTLYLAAARLLTLAVFGLLSYVEPVLMFVAALLLGERVVTSDAVAYGLLAVALAILSVGSTSPRR
ncbi:EamA family transporter RarD [Microbacterium gorillae]|uniref:EamA family transporter RarD n=1 Tax=Microbacterium gorillae TaxID=1231063 RepID=UPI003D993FF4